MRPTRASVGGRAARPRRVRGTPSTCESIKDARNEGTRCEGSSGLRGIPGARFQVWSRVEPARKHGGFP